MTDTEWLNLMKQSPKKAHLALIDEYGNYVYAIVISKLRNCAVREDIEDCVSDIFVEVFRSADRFCESKGSLKGFISSIAQHIAINAFKCISYQRRDASSLEDEKIEFLPSDDNTENDTQKKLFQKRLWEIVDSLGEPDNSIIIYQYFYDLTVSEISKKISMTPDAVQKRSIRARERIKKILESENYF